MSSVVSGSSAEVPELQQQQQQQLQSNIPLTFFPEQQPPNNSSNIPLIACATLASVTVGGTNYAFSLYGNALQSALSLSENQIVTLSTTIFFGGLVSWIPGIAIDTWGERLAIMVGGLGSASCLFLFWLLGKKVIQINSQRLLMWILCTTGIVMFWMTALVVGSVFKLVARHCGPGSKGTAVGLAKGYLGLGAGVYATLFSALNSPNPLDCLLVMGGYNILATTVPVVLLLPKRRQDETRLMTTTTRDDLTRRHFTVLYIGLALLVTLVLGHSLLTLYHRHSPGTTRGVSYLLLLSTTFIWIGPILTLLWVPKNLSDSDSAADDRDGSVATSPEEEALLQHPVPDSSSVHLDDDALRYSNNLVEVLSTDSSDDPDMAANNIDHNIDVPVEPTYGDEMSISSFRRRRQFQLREMLSTKEAWFLCYSCTILVGSGTLLINNMGSMVRALQLDDDTSNKTPAFVALFMAFQCLGRVVTGSLSEYSRMIIARPFFLVAAAILTMMAHGLLAAANSASLFVVGVALEGIAFGAVWPLIVLLVEELFGEEHLGANYMFYDGFVIAVGTLIISEWISANIYRVQQHRHHYDNDNDDACIGSSCFRWTHLIVFILAGTTIIFTLLLRYSKLALQVYDTKSRRRVAS